MMMEMGKTRLFDSLFGALFGERSDEVEFGRVHGIRLVRVGLLEEGGVEIVVRR